jgi:hypothetical protein
MSFRGEITMSLVAKAKQYLLPRESQPERILGGLLSGCKLQLNANSYLQRKVGLSERELHKWFRRLSKGVGTAIDIGAAEGEYTLYFLAKTSAKKVLAFEPQEPCLELLNRNLEMNGLKGDSRLELHSKFLGSSLNESPYTLDSFLSKVEGTCLIKMDVERNEYAILQGCPKLLARKGVSWIIEIHTPQLDVQCRTLLEKNGYQVRSIGPAWWRAILPEMRGDYISWMIATKAP